jgi:hypothetical protein
MKTPMGQDNKPKRARKKLAESAVERKSFRLPEIAKRHNFSIAFVYAEIAAKRLRARKAQGATIVTTEDEQDWLDDMPLAVAADDPEDERQQQKETAV